MLSRDLSLDNIQTNARQQHNSIGNGGSKIENYKRIKQEEAAARAQLLNAEPLHQGHRGALID